MPLVRFEVKNEYGLGDPELYRAPAKREDPKALLDGIAVAGLVGILRQLGDLAEFAADIFHDLHEQVMATSARGHRVLNRIQHIEEALPSLEKTLQGQTSHIHFAYVAGSHWHANLRTEQSHLLSIDLPRFMLDSYEECRDPPRLYLLDIFDTGGTGSCLKRYSDPSYFKRAWSASESEKAERVPRENKPLRNKRRRSRIRNLEVQHVVPISRRNSRSLDSSTRFASPSIDGLGFSTEQISMSDMLLNPKYESGTTSSGSKTGLSFVDQSVYADPSLATVEAEIDKLSVSKMQTNHNDSCSASSNVDRSGNTADDDSHHDSLQGSNPRSPSVTWDEKTEILKPTSPRSCDNVPIDRDRDSEALPETSEPSNINLEIAEFGDSEQNNMLLDIPNRQPSMSGGIHFDEVTSETDNYMDALNTLESETEMNSECQTKREVKSLSNFGYKGMEPGNENMHGTTAINSDSSDIETPVASHNPLSKDAPPESSERSEQIKSFEADIVQNGPNLDISAGNNGSVDVSDALKMNGSEGIKDNSSADSRAPDLQKKFFVQNSSTSESIYSPCEASSVSSTKLWTNGGLLGLEPSKPPDFSVYDNTTEGASGSKNTGCDSSSYTVTTKSQYGEPSGKSEAGNAHNESMSRNFSSLENIDGSPNTLSSVDRSSLNSDQLLGIIYNVAEPNGISQCSPSFYQQDDVSDKQNSGEYVEALPLSQFENTRDTPDDIYAHMARHDQKIPDIAPGAELPDKYSTESQPNESDESTMSASSSFSGLAQRFLANNLQRRVLITPIDIFNPSGVMNTDVRSQDTSIQNKHKEGPTEVVPQISFLQNIREKTEQGSFKKYFSSSSRYFESSSPPLEHMKISFHPMNSSDATKLKLKFPDAITNLHESIEDLTFPSFQLVPGPVLPLPDTSYESDDDTFCRSSAYSSEDIHTPHSYSNSELWEQDEMSGSKDDENYDDSRRISSSTASSSSLMELEQINHRRIDSASGFENYEAKDDTMSLHSGLITDLPGLDSVISLKNQEEGHYNSVSDDHVNSALQLPNELPPPPPLPPMQWRLTKASFTSGEDKGSCTSADVEHVDDLQSQRFLVAQQLEQTSKRPPCITESITAHSNKKTVLDIQKLNGNREQNHVVNHVVNGNNVDEREDLLHQIRNKAFNLRRIMPAKPTVTPQPTTNVNVVAILEKANAIRQACIGSDEGGDDNWSDS